MSRRIQFHVKSYRHKTTISWWNAKTRFFFSFQPSCDKSTAHKRRPLKVNKQQTELFMHWFKPPLYENTHNVQTEFRGRAIGTTKGERSWSGFNPNPWAQHRNEEVHVHPGSDNTSSACSAARGFELLFFLSRNELSIIELQQIQSFLEQ